MFDKINFIYVFDTNLFNIFRVNPFLLIAFSIMEICMIFCHFTNIFEIEKKNFNFLTVLNLTIKNSIHKKTFCKKLLKCEGTFLIDDHKNGKMYYSNILSENYICIKDYIGKYNQNACITVQGSYVDNY